MNLLTQMGTSTYAYDLLDRLTGVTTPQACNTVSCDAFNSPELRAMPPVR